MISPGMWSRRGRHQKDAPQSRGEALRESGTDGVLCSDPQADVRQQENPHQLPGGVMTDRVLGQASFIDLLTALVQRLQYDAQEAVGSPAQSILQAISRLEQSVAGLRQDLASYRHTRAATEQEMLEQLDDLRNELNQQRAAIHDLRGGRERNDTFAVKESAIRALIAVDGQFAPVLAALDSDRQAVMRGQRSNLRQTLAQLGVNPIEPTHGTVFDAQRHRSSSQATPTADQGLHERVAELRQSGWELSNGQLIQPAEVTVYVYEPAIPPLVGHQAVPAESPPQEAAQAAGDKSGQPQPAPDEHNEADEQGAVR